MSSLFKSYFLVTFKDQRFPPDQSCHKCGPVIKEAHFNSGVTIGGQLVYGIYHYLPNCS